METLRAVLYAGEDVNVWGYITESGGEVRLGRKHYAERVCSELGTTCVKMQSISIPISQRAVPVGEGKTFRDFLMCESDKFQANLLNR